MLRQALSWPRSLKRALVVGIDVLLALVSTWVAYSLRFETLHWPQGSQWWVYLLGPVLAFPIFVRFGLYRAIFRYSGLDAMLATAKAVLLYALLRIALLWWQNWPTFPLTLGVLQPILFFLLVASSRAMARCWPAAVSPTSAPRAAC
jgi:FlaA1/EpsC-like NDP-sugar epimerase